ncbi:ATP-dependent nuclease [Embleya sp. NPDC020630]|uniref:ATP-dependent nuclease n=1 Tax=Embleya sp. NPDC020630 TaxID=3363979 RepID=UPI00379B79BF
MTDYKSEVRDSVIHNLEAKVAKGSYGQYLKRLTLRKVRGFVDREVSFDFPVTALVGSNGGGKTTVLGAAALAYASVLPGRFFAKSGKYDASMLDWSIEYELIEKRLSTRLPVARTASFKKSKWSRKAVEREVLVFGVERTLPATERAKPKKARSTKFTAVKGARLPAEVTEYAARILGKPIEGFLQLDVDPSGRVTMFSGVTRKGELYSEFHFGAGEASAIRIVAEVEAAGDGALILIEEIENGLHPIATRRMVEYLIGVARRKSCQVVFTTHSNDALAPLPSSAIWAAYGGNVLQGKLDVKALRTITGQINAQLAIFVEDAFAEIMVTTALRIHGGVEMDAIKVHGMGGAQPAMDVNAQHAQDPTATFPSVCLLDGDQAHQADPARGILVLPGTTYPEAHVFERVLERLDELAAKLTVSLLLPTNQRDRVARVVRDRALSNIDRHVIWEQIGEDLDFTSAHTVTSAFLATWAQAYPTEVNKMVEDLGDRIPRREA